MGSAALPELDTAINEGEIARARTRKLIAAISEVLPSALTKVAETHIFPSGPFLGGLFQNNVIKPFWSLLFGCVPA